MNQKSEHLTLFIAALLSYPLAYYYVRNNGNGLNLFLFSLLFVTGVELTAHFMGKKHTRESIFWACIVILQGLAVFLYDGYHPEMLGTLQFPVIHLTAVYYVLVRCNVLVKEKTSGYLIMDLLEGLFVIPWKNYFTRLSCLHSFAPHSEKKQTIIFWISAGLITVVICTAWALLCQADAHFASIASGFTAWLGQLFQGDWWLWLLLSLPVGSWLSGLVIGAARQNASTFHEIPEEKRKVIPAAAWQIMMVLLSLIYLIFFIISLLEYLNARGYGMLSAPAASEFAVRGFYSLLAIMALNAAVTGGAFWFGKNTDLMHGRMKASALILTGCSIAFWLLDACKLQVYQNLYGFTPRRFYAAWALAWMLAAVTGIAVRLFHRYACMRYLLCSCIACFTALCLFPSETFILSHIFHDYEKGIHKPDASVLMECDLGNADHVLSYSEILVRNNWYDGMRMDEIISLYPEEELYSSDQDEHAYYIDLKEQDGTQGRLLLTFQADLITDARME